MSNMTDRADEPADAEGAGFGEAGVDMVDETKAKSEAEKLDDAVADLKNNPE